jgi:quercetin dioxygenase-like cupin family protein
MKPSMPESQPITRKALLTAVLDGNPPVDRVRVAQIELAPAQETGLHLHPCPVVGYVVNGTIRFQVEGDEETILRPGDAFFEPANARVPHFDNAADREPATFVAAYLLSEGEDRLIVMLQ